MNPNHILDHVDMQSGTTVILSKETRILSDLRLRKLIPMRISYNEQSSLNSRVYGTLPLLLLIFTAFLIQIVNSPSRCYLYTLYGAPTAL